MIWHPHKVKTQYVHFRPHTNYFLLPCKISEEISRWSMLFNNQRLYLPYQTYVHTTFYHGSGLAWNFMFNGSISYVLCLHILHFYLVQQSLPACNSIETGTRPADLLDKAEAHQHPCIYVLMDDTTQNPKLNLYINCNKIITTGI